MTANLNDVKEKRALPGGKFHAIVFGAPKLTKTGDRSKNPGTDMLDFEIRVTDPVGDEYFSTLHYYVVRSATEGWAVINMKRIADACKVPYSAGAIETDDFAGRELIVIVGQQIYSEAGKSDQVRAQIDELLPA